MESFGNLELETKATSSWSLYFAEKGAAPYAATASFVFLTNFITRKNRIRKARF